MFFTILIIVFTLVALMALHEFGHFIFAKKFDAKVEEFGIGLPPRIVGRKIGETIYSLNWLPIGAFVKILGEDKRTAHPRSFSQKKLWQRALILFGGVASFWIISFVIITISLSTWGVSTIIPDDLNTGFKEAKIHIVGVLENSPAKQAGIEAGDIIVSFESNGEIIDDIDTVQGLLEFVETVKGQEIIISLQRGKNIIEKSVVPRIEFPEDDGPIGIQPERVANLTYAFYKAPLKSAEIVAKQTINIPVMLYDIVARKIRGERVVGADVMGIVGIGRVMGRSLGTGVGPFLTFISMISIWLALFNLLPIPALDGGRLLFLAIEAVRKKPVQQKIEQKITGIFFFILIGFMILITIKDIIGLF